MSGNLIIISAPSGTGKTTIVKQLFAGLTGFTFSVSHTTRPPRQGERNGVDYHFVDRQTFITMRDHGEFLEWAEVHGNFYGTSRKAVEEKQAAGLDVFLDIDVQGARQVRKTVEKNICSVFLVPPSWQEQERRLAGRGTDAAEVVALRLKNARQEMADAPLYDYLIVNDTVERAVDTLRAIVIAERSRSRRDRNGHPLVLPEP